jgi:2-phosphosulfolactate phosphatase
VLSFPSSRSGTFCTLFSKAGSIVVESAGILIESAAALHRERMAKLQDRRSVEVCFSPKLFPDIVTTDEFVVVLVDILRASTTICTAVGNGVEAIVPVATHEEARRLKSEGYLIASEKDGVQLDWADFGNSAFSFTRDAIGGKTLVYCTTNGTGALHIAKNASGIAIGAFINISALTEWLTERLQNVVVLCSGWKSKFCLEDTLFAGALTEKLLKTGLFRTECDSAHAAMDLWRVAEDDVLGYLEKAAQRHRLKKLGLDDVIPYSFSCDEVDVVPVFDGEVIRADAPRPGR